MWSRGAEEMLGLTEGEAVGNPLPIPLELLESQLPTSSRKTIELTWRLPNGEPLQVSPSVALLRDGKGDIQGKVVIFGDLISRRESEQERAELVEREQAARAQAKAERRFRELLEAAPYAILEIDVD